MSDCPNVSTLSLNTPTIVNGRPPLSLIMWPTAAGVDSYSFCASFAVITEKLAQKLYESTPAAVGHIIKLSGGLPFTIVGVFKESVDTFGQSDIQEDTMLIPYTVSRFFTPTGAVYQIYFSVATAQDVIPATDAIKRVLQSRHRPESVYS